MFEYLNGNIGIGTTNPNYLIDISGSIRSNAMVQSMTSSAMSMDLETVASGNSQQTNVKSISYAGAIPPKVKLEAKSLSGTPNGAGIASWGGWTQATGANQPLYNSSAGYQNGAFASFAAASLHHMSLPALSLDVSTNKGFSAFVLFRMRTSSDSQRVYDFNNANDGSVSSMVSLRRTGNGLGFYFSTGSSSIDDLIVDNVLADTNWMLITTTIGAASGSAQCMYKNGTLIGSRTTTNAHANRTTIYNYLARRTQSAQYSDLDLAALYVYDALLPANDFVSLTNYLLQGGAVLNSLGTNLMTINPFTRNETSGLALAPTATMEMNNNLRVHALPSNPLLVVDAYTPATLFINRQNLPTFDVCNNAIVFNRGSSQHLHWGTRTFNLRSRGFTLIAKVKFSGTAGSNERIIDFGSGNPSNNIVVGRSGTSTSIYFQIYNAGSSIGSVTGSATVAQEEVFTVFARYDPNASGGTMTLYKNNVSVGSLANVAANTRTLTQTYVGRSSSGSDAYTTGSVYCLAVYDCALTDDELTMAHAVLTTDVPYDTLEIGNRTGKQVACITKEGVLNADSIAQTINSNLATEDIVRSTSGSMVQWRATNLQVSGFGFGQAPVVRLEAKDLLASNANASSVSAWGAFAQSTTANQPVYYTASGYQNGQYIQFNNGSNTQFLQNASTLSWNFATNGGYTALFLARFDSVSVDGWDRIFQFFTTSLNTSVYITRTASTQNLQFGIGNGTTSVSRTVPFNNNEWAVWGVTIGAANGSPFVIYKNGIVVGSFTTTIALANITTATNYIARDETTINGKVSIGGLFVYDRMLSSDEFNTINNYLLQGASVLSTINSSILSINPFTRNDANTLDNVPLGATANALAGNLEANAHLRIHTLPPNPLFVIDAYTPPLAFRNTSNLPTFDTSNALITFSNATVNNQYMDLGPYTYSIASRGFTFLARLRFTGTARNYEYIFSAGTAYGTLNNMFGLARNLTNQQLRFFCINNSGVSYALNAGTFAQDELINVAARYDPTNTGTMSLWVNGAMVGSLTGASTSMGGDKVGYLTSLARSPDTNSITGSIAVAAAYDRALTDDEIRLAHQVMSTDVPYNTLEVGSRTGNPALQVTNTGNLIVQGNISAGNLGGFRNKIINGDMRIDQRRVGASQSYNASSAAYRYVIDRFAMYQATNAAYTVQQVSVTDLPGLSSALRVAITTQSATTSTWELRQTIEGFSCADLYWGTAYASPITVSFWVKSSVTGTYAMSVRNGSSGTTDRYYVATYRINVANTWEYKTITIPGETTSANWRRDNTGGLDLVFDLGSSTNTGTAFAWQTTDTKRTSACVQFNNQVAGSTWFLTGVQLEKGTIATPLEFRPYGIELILCQRYFYPIKPLGSGQCSIGPMYVRNTESLGVYVKVPDQFRTNITGNAGSQLYVEFDGGNVNGSTTWTVNSTTSDNSYIYCYNPNVGDRFPTSIYFDNRGNFLRFFIIFPTNTFNTAGWLGQAGEAWTGNNTTTRWWGLSAEY